MKNSTVRNDVIIDWRRGIIGKANWAASKSKKQITKEMELKKIVEKHKGENSKCKEIMRKGYERKGIEQKMVWVEGRRSIGEAGEIHVRRRGRLGA